MFKLKIYTTLYKLEIKDKYWNKNAYLNLVNDCANIIIMK